MSSSSEGKGDEAGYVVPDATDDVVDATYSDVLDATYSDVTDATYSDVLDATDPDAGEDADAWGDSKAPDTGTPSEAGKTTEDVLRARGPGCLPCAADAGALDINGFGTNCERFDSGSAIETCIETLQCVLNSGCAGPNDVVISCLCGTLDPYTACMDASPPLNGACTQDYYAGFETTNVSQIDLVFEDPTTPPGSANYLSDVLGSICTDCTLPTPADDGGSDGEQP